MKNKLKSNKTLFGIIFLGILASVLPITLLLIRDTQDIRSSAVTPDKLETESGIFSASGVTKQTDSSASNGSYILFNKNLNPTPLPSNSNKIYGPGLNIDSKNNWRVGAGSSLSNTRALSYRFKASTTSNLQSVSWELRLGDGYSLGNGGILKISVQTDDGTSNHFPSGQVLDSYTFTPGNSSTGGRNVRQNFPNKPLLNEGQIYHVVFENIASDPVNNYVSTNAIFTFNTYEPRQPNPDFNGIFALLYRTGNVWAYQPKDTPQVDLTYADGTHDGQAYSQALWEQPTNSSDPEQIGRIEGARMTREIFTVQGGDKTVTAAFIRVAQEYGTGNLIIALKNSTGAILGQGSVSASEISDYASDPDWYINPRSNPSRAGDWVSVKFNSPITIKNGSTYQLVMTAQTGTRYAMVPIRYRGWDEVYHESFAFREGRAQLSRDGGNTWEDNYNFQPYNNYQFYFTLQ